MNTLSLENVNKSYAPGAVKALQNVSLSLAPGSFVAIRGPSGCGKTTMLLVCGGLLRPDSGGVLIMGESLFALSAEKRAVFRSSRIGFVFQQFHLIPYLTVLENVALPGLNQKEAERRARDLLWQFQIGTHADRLPSALSTGERQRVAIARALINNPALLLADEPTGNLDEDNADIALDALRTFAESGGAVLLVTHDRSAAERADRVAEMKSGRLLQGENTKAMR